MIISWGGRFLINYTVVDMQAMAELYISVNEGSWRRPGGRRRGVNGKNGHNITICDTIVWRTEEV
jgi:hypothetical protein